MMKYEFITNIELISDKIDSLPFKNIQRVCNLIEFEGPIMTQFVTDDGKNIIYNWSDYNNDYNRWLVFEVSNENLDKFINRKIDLLSLYNLNEFVYIVDIGADFENKKIYKIELSKLPKAYLPEQNFFLSTI